MQIINEKGLCYVIGYGGTIIFVGKGANSGKKALKLALKDKIPKVAEEFRLAKGSIVEAVQMRKAKEVEKVLNEITEHGVTSAKQLKKLGVKSVEELIALGVTSADDLKRLGITSIKQLNKFGIKTAEDLAKFGINSVKELKKIGVKTADDLVKLGVNSAEDLEKLGITKAEQLEKLGITSKDDLKRLGVKNENGKLKNIGSSLAIKTQKDVKAPVLPEGSQWERNVLNSFDGGKSNPVTYEGGTTLYRVGGKNGGFWSLDPPPDTEYQWRVNTAIKQEFCNDGTTLYKITIPEGSSLSGLEGKVGSQGMGLYGGAHQVYIDYRAVPKDWIEISPTTWK